MDQKSINNIEGTKVAKFMKQVDELAKESNIEIAIFVKTEHAGSMFSNIRDVEEAGTVIAAGIMHSIISPDMPESASRFMDVIVSAAANTIDNLKDLKDRIINHAFTNN